MAKSSKRVSKAEFMTSALTAGREVMLANLRKVAGDAGVAAAPQADEALANVLWAFYCMATA